jgi:hypothetical protein
MWTEFRSSIGILTWPMLSCFGVSKRDTKDRMLGSLRVPLLADNIHIGNSATCELSSDVEDAINQAAFWLSKLRAVAIRTVAA